LDYRADGSWSVPFQAYALNFNSTTLQPRMFAALNGNVVAPNAGSQIATAQWVHMVGTYDGSNMVIYVNGAPILTSPQSGVISYGTSKDLNIGTRSPYNSAEPVNGMIDEARISTVARSADWLATEFNNQSSPSTFFQVCSLTDPNSAPCSAIVSPSTFSFSRPITLNHQLVPNTDQSNFPVLITGNFPYLATVANGGSVQSANGFDIAFSSDSGGLNK